MAWIINPTDPIGTWENYDVCIHTMADDGAGLSEIVLLNRRTGTQDWTAMSDGALWNDGVVWSAQSWANDVAGHGGFKLWFANFLGLVNTKFAAWAAAVQAPSDPTTIADFVIWLGSHTVVSSTSSGPVASSK